MAMELNQETVQKVNVWRAKSLCSPNRLPAHDSHKLAMTCAAHLTVLAGWAILAFYGRVSLNSDCQAVSEGTLERDARFL